MREDIRIPRKVETRFTIFGLGFQEMLIITPMLGVAYFLFQTLSMFNAILLSIFVVGVPYILLSQSKHGRTGLQYVIDMIKYEFFVQKRFDWSWSDEDVTTQVVRYEGKIKRKSKIGAERDD